MSEHTPEPWGLDLVEHEEGSDWPRHIAILDADGEEAATIVHREKYGDIPAWIWSNARLIAAAPKLLTFAEKMVTNLKGWAEAARIRNSWAQAGVFDDYAGQARTIIAEVKGERD